MTIKLWSPTPANNNSSPPLGAPEGWTSDQVNNWARQSMADVRSTVEQLPWFDWGDVPTYVSATELTLPGDLSARYLAARRIRATISAGNIFGTITSGIYGALTTVIVVWDGAGALDSSLTGVALGLDPFNAINLAQAQADFAALAGSSAQTFAVGDAVAPTQAAALRQVGRVVASYAAVRALDSTVTNYTMVQGRSSTGDGGQGWFRADASDTTSGDNDGTILVAADGMRWKRLFTGAFVAAWFGILPDGTDYSSEMQALVTYVGSIGTTPSGVIQLSGTPDSAYIMQWAHASGVMVVGQKGIPFTGSAYPESTKIQVPSAGGMLLTHPAGVSLVGGGFENIALIGQGASVSASAFKLGMVDSCHGFQLRNVMFNNWADQALVFGPSANSYHIFNMLVQNSLLNYSSLTEATYAADLGGQDGTIIQNIEVAASNTALTSSNRYSRALRIGSATSSNFRIQNVIGEFGDVALVVEGLGHHLGNMRAEFAYAQNFIGNCIGSQFLGLAASNGSRAGAGLYDSILWESTSSTNQILFEHCIQTGPTYPLCAYSVNDLGNDNSHSNVQAFGFTNAAVNNNVNGAVALLSGNIQGLTANSTAPRIDSFPNARYLPSYFSTGNTVATSITQILGIVQGGVYRIRAQDSNTTLVNGSGFSLPGAADLLLTVGKTYTFISFSAGLLELIGTS